MLSGGNEMSVRIIDKDNRKEDGDRYIDVVKGYTVVETVDGEHIIH